MARSLKDSLRRAMETRKSQFPPAPDDMQPGGELGPDEDTQVTMADIGNLAPKAPTAPSPPVAPPAAPPKAKAVPRSAQIKNRLDEESAEDPDTGPERVAVTDPNTTDRSFVPMEPRDFKGAGIEEGMVEALILKHLLMAPGALGMEIAKHVALRPKAVRNLLQDMKLRKMVVHRGGTATGDFSFELTEKGVAAADDANSRSRYVGAAPVPLEQYADSVKAQSIGKEVVHLEELKAAFSDLIVSEDLLHELGPAMVSGKGMFMYGNPGNGKTALSERMTRAYGSIIFMPHAIVSGSQIIRLFDPVIHEVVPVPDELKELRLDNRWVLVKRPTVVVGGELTLDALELDYNPTAGTCEAPIQLKANCGTLVIDDFGRQRVDPAELLNRWIVPLEQRKDFLTLPDGRKVEFPFDPLIIFSTNLNPEDLVDEAFLRRIPYKIEIPNPEEHAFKFIFEAVAKAMGFEWAPEVFDYLVLNHYQMSSREFRACHPRDLLLQVRNQCLFKRQKLVVTPESLDEAARLYFSVFGETAAKTAG